MSMPERFQPKCPPDAHKVMRDPENQVKASLAVAVNDSELDNGADNICELIAAFSKKPLVLCSERVKAELLAHAGDSGITPEFVEVLEAGKCRAVSAAGAVGANRDFTDLTDAKKAAAEFLEALKKDGVIAISMPSMYILRSVSTVYAWDALLARQFLSQYEKAASDLSDSDRALLTDVRYGRQDALKVKELSASAYPFLRLERKLFLQYPTED